MISDEKLAEAYEWDSDEVEARLGGAAYEEQLVALLGRQGYEDARQLVLSTRKRAVRKHDGVVLILPGVVGSKLGDKRRDVIERLLRVIWLNPLRIAGGGLRKLRVAAGEPGDIQTYGVFLKTYLRLKLSLERAGWDTDYVAFDWRLSLERSADTLIRAVNARGAGPVYIVAHSMGGLLVRAAIARDPNGLKAVKKIITLGTPHHGSFSPVPLLRGIHSTLKLAAGLDLENDATELARDVFATMPGFYELLPNAKIFENHLFDTGRWPTTGVTPGASLLAAASAVQSRLPLPDERFRAIIGYGNPTLSSATLMSGDLRLRCSNDGDGAVLFKSSEIKGVPTWYTNVEHGELPNGEKVRAGVLSLLTSESAASLEQKRPTETGVEFDWKPKRTARAVRRVDGGIDPETFRQMLDAFEGDAETRAAAPNVTSAPVRAGRGRVINQTAGPDGAEREPRQFELRLQCGSIADASARAYAVGVFDSVKPAGATAALDAQMDGALGELHHRNMISGAQGWINAFPGTRRPLRADLICLVGLGLAGQLSKDGVASASANLVRYLINAGYEDCAVVLFGAHSTLAPEDSLKGLVKGALQAICEVDKPHFFRSLTVCEINEERFETLVACAEAAIDEAGPPKPVQVRRVALAYESGSQRRAEDGDFALARVADSLNVSVTGTRTPDGIAFTYNLVPSGGGGTTILDTISVSEPEFDGLFADFKRRGFPGSLEDVGAIGAKAWAALVPERIQDGINLADAERLVFSVDRLAARIPWETMRNDQGIFLALDHAMSRRHASTTQAVGKWIKRSGAAGGVRVLLVVNPTSDLDGADSEGTSLLAALSAHGAKAKVDVLLRDQATKRAIIERLGSGVYDVLHYAGHASYEPTNPEDSGLLASDGMITSRDIATLASTPAMVFLNACESGRVRQRGARSRGAVMHDSISFAEAILDGGVASFIGTYWPVSDSAAATFANQFYGKVLGGEGVGRAVHEARKALFEAGEPDWADYLFFGDNDFSFGFLRD